MATYAIITAGNPAMEAPETISVDLAASETEAVSEADVSEALASILIPDTATEGAADTSAEGATEGATATDAFAEEAAGAAEETGTVEDTTGTSTPSKITSIH